MSINNNNNDISDFAKFGLLAENFVESHPNATTAELLVISEAVINGLKKNHADEKAANTQQVIVKDGELAEKDRVIHEKDGELKTKDDELELKDQQLAAQNQQLTGKDAELEQKDKQLVVAQKEEKKWKTKFKTLEEKLKGNLEAFTTAEEVARDNMKQRHKIEIQQAVATAVENKDEKIRTLKRENQLLKEFRRKSMDSALSDSSST